MKKYLAFFTTASLVVCGLFPTTTFAADAAYTAYNVNATNARFMTGDTAIGTQFGSEMTTGDFDGDGYQDIAVSTLKVLPGDPSGIGIFYGPLDITSMPKLTNAHAFIENTIGSSQFGKSLAAADINNDGKDDLFIGDSKYDASTKTDNGIVAFVPGSSLRLKGSLSMFPTITAFWSGLSDNEYLGTALASGDFDGDGKDDIAFGAPKNSANGIVYVIYNTGSTSITGEMPMSTANFDDKLTGKTLEEVGSNLLASDLNQDRIDDLVIAGDSTVSIHIVKGTEARWGKSMSLTTADAVIEGEAGGSFGTAMIAGDFSGNGKMDLVVSDISITSGAGKVYLLKNIANDLTGSTTQSVNTLVDTNYFGDAGSGFGTALTAIDFDKNGITDIAVGAPTGNGTQPTSGYVSLVLNNNTNEVRFQGIKTGDTFGSLLYAMDVNADGMMELLSSAPAFDVKSGIIATLFECVDADRDGYCASGLGMNFAGRGIDSNDADANSETKTTQVELTTEDAKSLVAVTAQEDGTILKTFSDDTTESVDLFTKSSGKPTVSEYDAYNRYVVYHPKWKSAKVLDGTTGELIDSAKLSKKKFSKGKGRIKKVGSEQKFLIVQMKKKKSSRVVAIKLDQTGSENFFKRKRGVHVDDVLKVKKKPAVKKMAKKKFEVRLKNSEGERVTLVLKKPNKKFTFALK